MNGTNGHSKDDFSGVWVMFGLTGGVNVLGRFLNPSQLTREIAEKHLNEQSWVALDQAYTLMLVSGAANGQPVFAEVCVPYGQSRDEKQMVSIQVCNIVSTIFFEDMGRATRETMEKHISQARNKIMQMRAATANITIAR